MDTNRENVISIPLVGSTDFRVLVDVAHEKSHSADNNGVAHDTVEIVAEGKHCISVDSVLTGISPIAVIKASGNVFVLDVRAREPVIFVLEGHGSRRSVPDTNSGESMKTTNYMA